MPFARGSVRFVLAIFGLFSAPQVFAQITNVTNQTSPPIAGAGHDYIHMLNETVNPANGSISMRIQVPTPAGRHISLPFSFGYDSAGALHVAPDGAGQNFWTDNSAYLARGGWSYSVPMISNLEVTEALANGTIGHCTYDSNWVLEDESAGRHALYLQSMSAAQPPARRPFRLFRSRSFQPVTTTIARSLRPP